MKFDSNVMARTFRYCTAVDASSALCCTLSGPHRTHAFPHALKWPARRCIGPIIGLTGVLASNSHGSLISPTFSILRCWCAPLGLRMRLRQEKNRRGGAAVQSATRTAGHGRPPLSASVAAVASQATPRPIRRATRPGRRRAHGDDAARTAAAVRNGGG